jgi:hypothetical protein
MPLENREWANKSIHRYSDVIWYRISLSLLLFGLVTFQLTAFAVGWGGGSMSINRLQRTVINKVPRRVRQRAAADRKRSATLYIYI